MHVAGVIGIFVGYGTLVLGTIALRRVARVEDARVIARVLTAGRQIGFEHVSVIDAVVVASVLVVGLTGLDMARYTGDWRSGWAQVSIATIVLLAPIGPFVINPRLLAVARAVDHSDAGPLPLAVKERLSNSVLTYSLRGSVMTLLGLVYVMVVKPSPYWAIVGVLLALAVGLGWAAAESMVSRRARS